MKITHHDLYDFLVALRDYDDMPSRDHYVESSYGQISQEAWDFLLLGKDKLRPICVEQGMTENHIGGDDVLRFIDGTIEAIEARWRVITWYGPDTEVLVCGIHETYGSLLAAMS